MGAGDACQSCCSGLCVHAWQSSVRAFGVACPLICCHVSLPREGLLHNFDKKKTNITRVDVQFV